MSDVEINQLLQQMRNMAALAQNAPASSINESSAAGAGATDFGQLLKDSVDKVNETQKSSAEMSTAFEMGDPDVNLSEVMVAIQKASVSFQAMTQVRNNLVSAYKEVMNMQV